MARNTKRDTPVKLTRRGATVVAAVAALATAAVAVLLQSGYTTHVTVALGVAVLVFRYRDVLTSPATHRKALRGAAWAVVALAVYAAFSGHTGPGGTATGLALAAALATYLRLSRR